ncbi:hypothetical protein IG631_09880 [Alternaria alternata]|nr:hypothetical protein IG631_09880 [Alternaria alternata]
MTTASGGSPYLQHGYQAQISYPFTHSSPMQSQHTTPSGVTGRPSQYPSSRRSVTSLPVDVQSTIQSKDRRYIQTNLNESYNHEQLDASKRCHALANQHMLMCARVSAGCAAVACDILCQWPEPAGQVNPGKTRNSTHFSTVQYGETAFSEIRRFVVVRNKGDFSQCMYVDSTRNLALHLSDELISPVQTYRGRGAARPGLIMSDHGVIHTSATAPNLLPGEALTKYSIQVQSTEGELLEPESRVNYGKAYAVEHNVKVLDIGMVLEGHRYLIKQYFDAAMQAE